ncbi:hypothetical protein [Campylobacter ureolyticus]|uniref:hypothetical protein n=1 Tax=Campylobacter ureolyticus TaxID=827 RepID=UPI0022B55644|nr:hypothetical protein [Campylobacter ureolyticus]MCZ6164223.1 hypothetical protein [Campylobacter ureolyticus]MCZ6166088.1 hypothetical protein [Campylobacter ureolyticus]
MFLKSKDFKMTEKRISNIEDNISMIHQNLGSIDVKTKEILEKQYDNTYIKDTNKSILTVTKKLLKIEKLLEKYTQNLEINEYFSSYKNNTINLEKKFDELKIENTDEVKEFFAEYIKELVNLRADVNTMARYFNSEIKNIRNSIKDIQENDEYEDHWTEDNPDFVI